MSKVGSIIALSLGGTAVFATTYIGVAVAKGAAVREVPPFSWVVRDLPAPEDGGSPGPAPAPRVEEEATKPFVPSMTAGVLGSFVLPSPFDARELQGLQKALDARIEVLDAQEAMLERRSRELDDWQRELEARAKEIATLRREIDAGVSGEPADLASEQAGSKSEDPESWRAMSPLFEDGDAEEMATKLAEFEPEQAAAILKGLDPDRAAVLLNALPRDRYKPFLDAWRKAQD